MTLPSSAIRIDEVTYRVLAPNPSPMTLDGTNTYLLGRPGAGELVVVDPGPDIREHREAIEATARAADAAIAAVVVTHHHPDHAEAAGWAKDWQVPLHAVDPGLVPGAAAVADDAELQRAGLRLGVVHTPGHASDHLCLQVRDTGVVLAGDHVLGRGTSVVFWPDGDLRAYMASLRRLSTLDATRLDPGHGPSVTHPAVTLAEYLAHREERERQILTELETTDPGGDTTPGAIVRRVYADVDPALHPAAERSVRAHLAKLVAEGVVEALDPFAVEQPRLRRVG
jgi:glyoxylase-like metal-dependent hydrolase (beta-lactamase superfamily II)